MNNDEMLKWIEKTTKVINGNTTSLTPNTLLDSIGIDSLDVVELQMAYEDEFNVILADSSEVPITVGDLIYIISNDQLHKK